MHRLRHQLARLLTAISILFVAVCSWFSTKKRHTAFAKKQLEELEHNFKGRLGVFALNTADGSCLTHREHERFPVCSTFKMLVAAAILELSMRTPGLMQRRIHYTQSELVTYSPITENYVETGMTVTDICDAVMRYSDNTAANLLMKIVGGPSALTAFARSIGDIAFELSRWETELNTAIPGDQRDTSTPHAMGYSLQRLALGNILGTQERKQLQDWLLSNTTGAYCIQAGVPANWKVGDKTGSGDYGTRNDIAVIWPAERPPIILTVYTTQHQQHAEKRNDVIASAAKIVADWIQRS